MVQSDEERRRKQREYYQKNKENIKKGNTSYRIKNREKINKQKSARSKILQQERKKKVIKYYSKSKNCCNCCGETEISFLVIDHIKGGGGKHRKELKTNFYFWLIKNKFPDPDEFQVLCHNCNMATKDGGICPHQKSK